MDLELLASEYAKDTDFKQLVPVPRGRISRFDIKVALLKSAGKVKYKQIVNLIPEFANDPDFAQIDVLHEFSATVFNDLLSGGLITQAERDMITAMGYTQAPRWVALGFDREPDWADFVKSGAVPPPATPSEPEPAQDSEPLVP